MEVFEGAVKKYRIISRWQVQIELKGSPPIFHLFVDRGWALDLGDHAVLVTFNHTMQMDVIHRSAYLRLPS